MTPCWPCVNGLQADLPPLQPPSHRSVLLSPSQSHWLSLYPSFPRCFCLRGISTPFSGTFSKETRLLVLGYLV